jgi:putative FmdB family regulatory protein
MVYEYSCRSCDHVFDVVKRVSDRDIEEPCPKCTQSCERVFIPRLIHLSGTKVQEAEYNPGLGCVVKNNTHLKEICRQRNIEPIGNEKIETVHKHYDKSREEKLEKAWSEADKGWVGDGT